MQINLSQALIQHVLDCEYDRIPAGAIQAQKNSLMDMLGVMLAATGLDRASAPFAVYAAAEGTGPCTLLGYEEKTSPSLAALANGALVHALDFEDSHELATVHPNSAALPALMALSQEMGGISGKKFLAAMALASDVCCRLDLGANEDLLKYGWNMPPICGSMGAVMGAAKLLDLDAGQVSDAIALNLCQVTSSGESANSKNSAIRTIREGFAAQVAVASAKLAKLGVPARFDTPFEGKLGYYHMYARDNYTPEKVLEDLGKVYQGEFISFKPWPACRATHTSIDGILTLMHQHDIKPDEITRIHITLQEIGRMVTEPAEVKYRPTQPAIGKFSLPFVVATAVLHGDVTLDSFTPERLCDPAILAMADKVVCAIEPSWTKAQNKFTDMVVDTTRGQYKLHLEHPLGCQENPMTEDAMHRKFRSCAALAKKPYAPEVLADILDKIDHLDELEDVNELFGLL